MDRKLKKINEEQLTIKFLSLTSYECTRKNPFTSFFQRENDKMPGSV